MQGQLNGPNIQFDNSSIIGGGSSVPSLIQRINAQSGAGTVGVEKLPNAYGAFSNPVSFANRQAKISRLDDVSDTSGFKGRTFDSLYTNGRIPGFSGPKVPAILYNPAEVPESYADYNGRHPKIVWSKGFEYTKDTNTPNLKELVFMHKDYSSIGGGDLPLHLVFPNVASDRTEDKFSVSLTPVSLTPTTIFNIPQLNYVLNELQLRLWNDEARFLEYKEMIPDDIMQNFSFDGVVDY
jgi:hypothetical protein